MTDTHEVFRNEFYHQIVNNEPLTPTSQDFLRASATPRQCLSALQGHQLRSTVQTIP